MPPQGVNLVKQRFDIQTSVIYIGTAPPNTLDGNTGWTIKKITLSSGIPTLSQVTGDGTATWNNRATETYT